MGETKIGVIPGLMIQGAMGPRTYGLLLTDQRSIFVLEKESKALLGGVLGGALGAVIADAAAAEKRIDYEAVDPDRLAAEKKNILIPHASVEWLRLKRLGRSFSLSIKYARPDGKAKRLKAHVLPPKTFLESRKAEGVKGGVARREFAAKVREAYERAFPSHLAHRMEWRL